MYLIDSSLWIEYFRPKGSSKVKALLRDLLQKEEALICGIVLIEVLRGARGNADFEMLQESLSALPEIAIDEDVLKRAARWGYEMDRKGKLVSTTDLIISACAFDHATLLHADSDFELIASQVDLNQERVL